MQPKLLSDPRPSHAPRAIVELHDALQARRLTLAALVAERSGLDPARGDTTLVGAPFDLALRRAEHEVLAQSAATHFPEGWRGRVVDSILIALLWSQHRDGAATATSAAPGSVSTLDAFGLLLDELREALEEQSDRTDHADREVHELLARALFRVDRLAEAVAAARGGPEAAAPGAGEPSGLPAAFPSDPGTHGTSAVRRTGTREAPTASATTRVPRRPPARPPGTHSHGKIVAIGRAAAASMAAALAVASLGYGVYASRAYLVDHGPAAIASELLEELFPGARLLEGSDEEKAQRLARIELSSDTTHAPPADVRERTLALCKLLASTRYERAVIVDRLSRPVATWIEGRISFQGSLAEPAAAVP